MFQTLLLNFGHLTIEPYQGTAATVLQFIKTLFTYLTPLILLGAFGVWKVLGTLRRYNNNEERAVESPSPALVLVQQTEAQVIEKRIPYIVILLMLVEFLLFRAILGASLFIEYWGPIVLPLAIFSVAGMDLQAKVHPELISTFYILQIQQFVTHFL
jgi:hypothetical protein